MTRFRRTVAIAVTACLTATSVLQGAQAAVIGTDQIAAAQAPSAGAGHARLNATLDRADVAAALRARGVDPAEARARVAALTDAEAATLAAEIDRAPAGGDVLGTIVFIFVLLLVTDILGFTKVFPFTRSIR